MNKPKFEIAKTLSIKINYIKPTGIFVEDWHVFNDHYCITKELNFKITIG